MDVADGTLLADYRVVRRLGAGGNGTFYLAIPPARLGIADDYVVVKVFTGSCAEDVYRRGVRELRAFAAVDSPCLARLYDAVLDGSFMYAMEYFPLGSLHDAVPALSRDRVLTALTDAALGVHALHEAGIAHGNLTPSSIMIVDGGARVSDLGMSRVLTSDLALTSFAPSASVRFTDPAILRGVAPSRATDVWSLGACLHYGLAGIDVYPGPASDDPVLTVRSALSAPPRVALGLDEPAADLIASCLGIAGARPVTALEVAERIDVLRRTA